MSISDGPVSMLGSLSPPVLFFFLGVVAAAVRSNLRVPPAITKLLSLYLLWAIGFRGGVELLASGFGREAMVSLALAMFLATIVPLYVFFLLRRRLDTPTAAAISATYGSISAITFMTACTVLEQRHIEFGGHMVAAMALMESPAIVIAVLLWRKAAGPDASPLGPAGLGTGPAPTRAAGVPWGKLLHEAFLNGPVLLLLGSLAIGLLTGERGYKAFKPLCTDLFNGVLVFFLLDLGLVAARKLRAMRGQSRFLVAFSILSPLVNAALAIVLARVGGLREGDAVLLAVLAASASYIAVPAAMRLIIPQANPGLYLPMALGMTFPFNITVGIPLYTWVVHAWWPG
jgi:hypothetical protein